VLELVAWWWLALSLQLGELDVELADLAVDLLVDHLFEGVMLLFYFGVELLEAKVASLQLLLGTLMLLGCVNGGVFFVLRAHGVDSRILKGSKLALLKRLFNDVLDASIFHGVSAELAKPLEVLVLLEEFPLSYQQTCAFPVEPLMT
jgi:hypothetical protein